MRSSRRAFGFTLIELLTVIAIIMLVAALSLPNFISMMRGRRFSAAVNSVQLMITRARSLATNLRTDISVEFNIQGDNGTAMWLESESNLIETMPPFQDYVNALQSGNSSSSTAYVFIDSVWYASGGERNGTYNQANSKAAYSCGGVTYYGDNARQSEVIWMGNQTTIDVTGSWSPNFMSWDAPRSGLPYGKDNYRDIRIAPHGALVQSLEPVLCFRETRSDQRKRLQVVRCTGRLVNAR